MADKKALIVVPQHSTKTLGMTIKIATLSIMAHHIVMLTVIYAEYRYVACHYAEYRGALFYA